MEATTRRVIILVLTMLISIPLFTVSNYIDEPLSQDFGLTLIQQLGPKTRVGQAVFNDTIRIQSNLDTPLIMIYIDTNKTDKNSFKLEWNNLKRNKVSELRDIEKDIVQLNQFNNQVYLAVYDLSDILGRY